MGKLCKKVFTMCSGATWLKVTETRTICHLDEGLPVAVGLFDTVLRASGSLAESVDYVKAWKTGSLGPSSTEFVECTRTWKAELLGLFHLFNIRRLLYFL